VACFIFEAPGLSQEELKIASKLIEKNKNAIAEKIALYQKGKKTKPLHLTLKLT